MDEDIASLYSIPSNSYVDKCICLISHLPYFQSFRQVLEEIHRMCFSAAGCSKPIWETVAHVVSAVRVPHGPHSQLLFTVENSLVCLETPPPAGSSTHLPFTEISFQPLVQSLDEENLVKLFTAVSLERRVILLASKYELLTTVAEAICHLKYPLNWMLTYIPVLPVSLQDLIESPGSYLYGICTSDFKGSRGGQLQALYELEWAVIVDLDTNKVIIGGHEKIEEEQLPPLPEPELSTLKKCLRQVSSPERLLLDRPLLLQGRNVGEIEQRLGKPWGRFHDHFIRKSFLSFFASLLTGYNHFLVGEITPKFSSLGFHSPRFTPNSLSLSPLALT